MGNETVKHIDPIHAAFGGKVFPHPRAKVFALGIGAGITVQCYPCDAVERCPPHLIAQIEVFRWQRFDRAALPRFVGHCFFARRVIIADLLGAFLIGIAGLRVGEIHALPEMVESGVEFVVKQRQPVFHTLIARARADGFIKWVVFGHRPEGCRIAASKARNSLIIQMYFTSGKQENLVALFFAALGFGVETAD